MVVGTLIGEGAAREEGVVGAAPHLAARLQAIAGPGEVVIAPVTRRLIGRVFELEPLAPRRLKGIAGPVAAFRVVAEGAAESRFAAQHGDVLSRLIGREEELALLLGRWQRARPGEGQVLLLQGEPGIGKSRLVEALREVTRENGRYCLRYQASPHHRNSALWPVAKQLERAAGIGRDDPTPSRCLKLETLLGRAAADSAAAAAHLAPLFAVDGSGSEHEDDLTPQQHKQRIFAVLMAQLAGLARQKPVLFVLEDLHWLDPTTGELFDLIVDQVQQLPVLLTVTFRPDLAPPWMHFPHVSLLTLSRLGRGKSASLIADVAGELVLPTEVVEAILARTEGVPLFVEELTKTVLESGSCTLLAPARR